MWKRDTKLPTDEELHRLMENIGLPVMYEENIAESQRRYFEACRHLRESRIWMLALLSAMASFASALAAWFAVLSR
jgi:hypothetical protein